MRIKLVLYSFIILFIAYFTYFRNYQNPANLFWDENYHIASSQKYLSGVFFMEPHPPLGKLLVALGEKIFSPNKHIDTSSFLTTDYIKDVPKNYSFIGVRFFPVLFAALSSVLFFLILYYLSGYALLSFLFTSFYLFENAIIVHSRGAMLEPIQIFFVLLLIGWMTRCINMMSHHHKTKFSWYLIAGFIYGLIISVKLNGAMMGFTLIILLASEYHYLDRQKVRLKYVIFNAFLFILATVGIFTSIYTLHIIIASKPMQGRYYEASQQYKEILKIRSSTFNPLSSLQYFPLMFKEHIQFIFHYEQGVPLYDSCKVGENGSLPITWPFGNKSINYRWDNGGGHVKYLYLQGNPIIWGIGLFGIVMSLNLLISYLFFNIHIKNSRLFFFIVILLMLYVLYMGMMMGIQRVMYLYHYFIPLLLSLFLAFLMFLYLFEETLKKNKMKVYLIAIGIVILIIFIYFFFSPLTYYQPLTTNQFELRNWFPFWGLKHVK